MAELARGTVGDRPWGRTIATMAARGLTGQLNLFADGKEVARKSLEHTIPVTFPEDETFDIGEDTRTGVAMVEHRYDPPFKFTGKINKVTLERGSAAIRSRASSLRSIASASSGVKVCHVYDSRR